MVLPDEIRRATDLFAEELEGNNYGDIELLLRMFFGNTFSRCQTGILKILSKRVFLSLKGRNLSVLIAVIAERDRSVLDDGWLGMKTSLLIKIPDEFPLKNFYQRVGNFRVPLCPPYEVGI